MPRGARSEEERAPLDHRSVAAGLDAHIPLGACDFGRTEVGHHIQNLVGITSRVASADQADAARKNALSVRVELQADCLAGVWAHSAYQRSLLEPGDIEEALHAAEVVGDDFLANASGSSVTPDSWTHGSSAQRQQWFTAGYINGSPGACDTFASS